MKLKVPTYCLVAALAFIAPALQAAVITPLLISGSSTSTTTTIGSPRTIDAALDGSGLTAVGDVSTWTHAAAGNSGHYLSAQYVPAANVVNETITLDFGAAYDIDNIYLWAYNRAENNRGIQTFDIAFDTGSGFGSAVSASSLGITNFTQGVGSGTSSTQTRTFTSTQTGVERIRLTNITNFGGDRIGISEIRFGGTAVPEPSAALLGGIGALLFVRRRK